MKTSNMWLLAAAALLLGSLSAFNLKLRAEYATGAYKDPLRDTKALPLRNFSEVEVQSASILSVKLVAGPYSVRVRNSAEPYVKVSQQGQRLVVKLVFPQEKQYLGGGQALTISLPQLQRLTLAGTYSAEGKPVTTKQYAGGSVQVQGFRQDSLRVVQDHGTRLELAANSLGYLGAETARTPGSQSVLRIANTNRIGSADLRVQHQGELDLQAGNIRPLRTEFGDSVRVTLSGNGLGNLGFH